MQAIQKIIVSDCEFPDYHHEKTLAEAAGIVFEKKQFKEEEDLIEHLQEADVILVQYAKFTRRVLMSLPRCKGIVRYGIGVDNFDLDAAGKAGIMICNVTKYGLHEVSDHAIALLFGCIRKIPMMNRLAKKGVWDFNLGRPMKRIAGNTLGIIGFGNIPRVMVQKLAPWGFEILVHDPYVSDETLKKYGARRAVFEEAVQQSDYVSVHAPLTSETHHLFNYQIFKKMKRDAVFVNTSRGPLVDEDGLYRALKEGLIASAGIDVMNQEPAPAVHPLFELDNIILSPHIAFYSEESCSDLQRMAAEEAVRIVKGETPDSCVNLENLKPKV